MTRAFILRTLSTTLRLQSASRPASLSSNNLADAKTRAAVERVLEVCGEAMNQLQRNAPAVAEKIPHARDIIGFRNILAHGYADMVTPYAASRYVLDHLPPMGDPSRTQLVLYRGGHMFYTDAESRRAFSADAKAFYQSTQ